MQQCPECDMVYDESEYSKCPYCSGELDSSMGEVKIKHCPDCGGIMYWFDDIWECSNCDCTIETDEDDYDAIMET